MNKRILSIILTFGLIASLAACGKSDTSSSSDDKKDDFPKEKITIAVAYSAGGSSDKLARMVQPYLKDALGVDVVVENQEGAGGQIAAEALMRGKNDGYQLLAVNSPGIFYTVALQDTTYDYGDLVPVWVESYDPIVMLAMKSSEFDSLSDFIDAAKENPGKYSIGVTTNSGQQATALWLQKNLDLDVNIVAYDGGSDGAAALLGGHVDVIFGDAYARVDLVDEAKALGIGTIQENTAWPDAVPFNEQLKKYDVEMPSDEFQARMGCYFVSAKFKEEYPDRYETLIKAFETAATDEEYVNSLKEAKVYDSMLLKSGADYAEQMENAANEVKDVVAPMFK